MKKTDKTKQIQPFDTFDPFALSENKTKPLTEEEVNAKIDNSVDQIDALMNPVEDAKPEIKGKERDEIYDFLPNDFPYTNNQRFHDKKGLKFTRKIDEKPSGDTEPGLLDQINEETKENAVEKLPIVEEKAEEIVALGSNEAKPEEESSNKTEPIEENKSEIKTSQNVEEIVEKPKYNGVSAWKFFITHKRFYIPLFFTLLVMIITGYLTSPFQKNGKTLYFALDLVALGLTLVASVVLILCIRGAMKKENYKPDDLMFAIIFSYIFLIGFILTIFFRLWALYNPNSFLNIGGLFSLFSSVIALLICLFAALYPFKRYKR